MTTNNAVNNTESNAFSLANDERAAIRREAIQAGVKTSGWTDLQLSDWYASNSHGAAEAAEKAAEKPAAPLAQGNDLQAAIQALMAALPQQSPGLSREDVLSLIDEHTKTPRPLHVSVSVNGTEGVTIEGAHCSLPEVMGFIAAGENVCAVGPAGSGKSTMFEQIAAALELDYYFQSTVQQEHKVLGQRFADGTYIGTAFRDAYEKGGLYVVEEFDSSHPRALLAINNAISGRWADFPDGRVEKHADFRCVMAGNTYGTGATREYVGRQQIDAATLDRFAFVEIPYDTDLERRAALAFNPNAGAWVDTVQAFREKVSASKLRHVVSPRASIGGAKALAAGVPREACLKAYLYKGLPADQLAQMGV